MSKPVKKYSSGRINMAVWENEYEGQKNYSFSFQKSYKKKDGSWANDSFFSDKDLYDIMSLCTSMTQKRVKERATGQAEGLNNPQYQQQTPVASNVNQVFNDPYQDDKVQF